MIPALVLSAGASARMGRPKALLSAGGPTFLGRIVHTLRTAAVDPVVVVIRPGASDVAAEATRAGATTVVNPRPDEGQLSSLLAGLDAVERSDTPAVLVTLVDVPLIRVETIRTLLDRFDRSRARILRATCQGRHGHPVIFTRATFDALRHADPSLGAKDVLRRFSVEDVEVDDPAVVDDIDTPDDYARRFAE